MSIDADVKFMFEIEGKPIEAFVTGFEVVTACKIDGRTVMETDQGGNMHPQMRTLHKRDQVALAVFLLTSMIEAGVIEETVSVGDLFHQIEGFLHKGNPDNTSPF